MGTKRRITQKRAVKRYIGNLGRKYELTPENFVRLLVFQRRMCAICHRTREELQQDLVVDHNHATEEVRGLLCKSCNRTIGVWKDDPVVLQRAVGYLTNPPAQIPGVLK